MTTFTQCSRHTEWTQWVYQIGCREEKNLSSCGNGVPTCLNPELVGLCIIITLVPHSGFLGSQELGMTRSHAQTQASSGVIKGRGKFKNSLSWTEDVTYQEVGRVPSQLTFASLHFFLESLVPKQQIWCHPHAQHANQTMSFRRLGFCKCPYFFSRPLASFFNLQDRLLKANLFKSMTYFQKLFDGFPGIPQSDFWWGI